MNTFRHQWKWDFRRVRVLWFFWILLLVSSTVGNQLASLSGGPFGGLSSLLTMVQVLTVFLLGILLVAYLMYTTPFAGDRAFWKTRPLTRGGLFLSKTAMILLLVWLPVVLAQLVSWALAAPGVPFLVWGTAYFGCLTLAMFLLAAVWAALCARGGSFVLGFAGSGAWAMLCAITFTQLASRTGLFPIKPEAHPTPINFQLTSVSTTIAGLVLLAVGMVAAWIVAGRGRSHLASRAAVVLVIAAIALATSAGSLWRVRFFAGPDSLVEMELTATVLAENEEPAPGQQLLWEHVAVEVPDGHVVEVRWVQAALRKGNKVIGRSSVGRQEPASYRRDLLAPIARTYPAGTSFFADKELSPISPISPITLISGLDGSTGTLRGDFLAQIAQWRKIASLPFAKGARARRSDCGMITVVGISDRNQELELNLGHRLPPPVFRTTPSTDNRERYTALAICVLHFPEEKLAVAGSGGSYSSRRASNLGLEFRMEEFEFDKSCLRGPDGKLLDLSKGRLDVYEAVPVATAHPSFRRENWTAYSGRGPAFARPAAPDEIPEPVIADLPANPTPAQVDAYLDGVLFIYDSSQGGASEKARARLLAIGPEHLDRLLARLPAGDYADHLVMHAVRQLAAEEHLPALLDALQRDPRLASVIRERGWSDRAAPILAGHLAQRRPLPWSSSADVVLAVAGQRDPATYDDLRWHFVHAGSGHRRMAEALAACPDFPLAEAVREAWSRAQFESSSRHDELAPLAAGLGDKEALRDAFVRCVDERRKDDLKALGKVVRHPGGDLLPEWLHANFEALEFDAESGRWFLPN